MRLPTSTARVQTRFSCRRASNVAKSLRLNTVCQQLPVLPENADVDFKEMYGSLPKLGKDVANTTFYPKAADTAKETKDWYIIDAAEHRLGRLATQVAIALRGKNNPKYHPAANMGSYVIVINAEKINVTGNKLTQKVYRRHSGRPGGLKTETLRELQERLPERVIEKAVKGMLPKGALGRDLFRYLKVYKGSEHPHEAQQPKALVVPSWEKNLYKSPVVEES